MRNKELTKGNLQEKKKNSYSLSKPANNFLIHLSYSDSNQAVDNLVNIAI